MANWQKLSMRNRPQVGGLEKPKVVLDTDERSEKTLLYVRTPSNFLCILICFKSQVAEEKSER